MQQNNPFVCKAVVIRVFLRKKEKKLGASARLAHVVERYSDTCRLLCALPSHYLVNY